MKNILGQSYYPPVGFYFRVDIADTASIALSMLSSVDNSFQEVSGLSVDYKTETINEGGENRFSHKLPTKTEYPNLVLKRGLVTSVSKFSLWCLQTMSANLSEPIVVKNIAVTLLNEKGSPAMSWFFMNAWPVKVQVSDLQAMENKLAIETMEFSYQYYQRI